LHKCLPFREYGASLGVRSAWTEWLVGARFGTPKVIVQEFSRNYADLGKSLKDAQEKMKATPSACNQRVGVARLIFCVEVCDNQAAIVRTFFHVNSSSARSQSSSS
jgi:hypothetical protein